MGSDQVVLCIFLPNHTDNKGGRKEEGKEEGKGEKGRREEGGGGEGEEGGEEGGDMTSTLTDSPLTRPQDKSTPQPGIGLSSAPSCTPARPSPLFCRPMFNGTAVHGAQEHPELTVTLTWHSPAGHCPLAPQSSDLKSPLTLLASTQDPPRAR